MGDCGQLWEEGQKSFTSGRSFWKGTELHNRGVSQALWCFSTERNPFSKFFGFSFICYEEYAILLTLTQPSAQWSNFTKTYWHSDTFFPPKLIIFFQSTADVVGFDGMLDCLYFIEKNLFPWAWKDMSITSPSIPYGTQVCCVWFQSKFFYWFHLFFDRYTYLPSVGKRKIQWNVC